VESANKLSDKIAAWVNRIGRRNSLLFGFIIIAVPVLEAWWSLFSGKPLVPTLLGWEGTVRIFGITPWGILLPPAIVLFIVGYYVFDATRPTQPFVPDATSTGEMTRDLTYFSVRIENGLPSMYRGCYGQVVSCTRVDGMISEEMPKPGDRLVWGYGDRARESVTITSMSGGYLVLAVFDRTDPDHFQVPIGIGASRTMGRSGTYKLTVEVGSSQTNSLPTKFSFAISAKDESIEIGRITQLGG